MRERERERERERKKERQREINIRFLQLISDVIFMPIPNDNKLNNKLIISIFNQITPECWKFPILLKNTIHNSYKVFQ